MTIANGTAIGQLLEWSGTSWTPTRQVTGTVTTVDEAWTSTGMNVVLQPDETVLLTIIFSGRSTRPQDRCFCVHALLSAYASELSLVGTYTLFDTTKGNGEFTVTLSPGSLECTVMLKSGTVDVTEWTVRMTIDSVRNGVLGVGGA